MKNLLLEEIDYKIEQTSFGTWKRYMDPAGHAFHEFTSHHHFMGLPLLHYTAGRNPETGRRKLAKGVIAIGRIAVGVIAIGQAAFGILSIGQLSLGLLLGLGQLCTGVFALGQLSLGVLIGIGQLATGYVAVGQAGFGFYVLAQSGTGVHVWDTKGVDLAARQFFESWMFWK